MNKLLIICDMFPPAFAPRMGYLCKYLTRMGWEVTVVRQYIRIPYGVCGRVLRPLLQSIRKDLKAYRMDVGHVSRHLVWL